jgi:hypothetical protein
MPQQSVESAVRAPPTLSSATSVDYSPADDSCSARP